MLALQDVEYNFGIAATKTASSRDKVTLGGVFWVCSGSGRAVFGYR